jgi:hypothetical protein
MSLQREIDRTGRPISGAHYLPAVGGARQPLLRDRRPESVAGKLFEGVVLS